MPITNLDFHFFKSDERFELKIYRRDDLSLLAFTNLDFPNWMLSGFELRQLDYEAKEPEERFNRLREYGHRLYQTIFTSDIQEIWSDHKRYNEFSVLCIRIAPEANELEAIPWETLFDGEEFIAAGIRTTISRLPLDVTPQAALPAVPLPVKMLALVSSPIDLADSARLQMEREQEILLEAINDPAGQGRLRVDFEDEAKLEILESSLETPYQIFHFTGHGLAPEDGGGLLLEDARGNSVAASVTEVVSSLRVGERHLRLVVLSGCQTARTLNVAGFRDLARGLLRYGVPAVIAMQFSISDSSGLRFAEKFYTRLATGHSLELALHAARRALWLSDDLYLRADALAPVLLTANGDCLQTTQAEVAPQSVLPEIDFSFFLPLPQLSHGFYGRRREYRQIRDAILQRNQRAVIVHGIGGIGKTALISHVATRMRKRFQGVYAFDCSGGTLAPETILIKLNQYFGQQGIKTLEQLLYQNLPADFLANHLAQVLSQWPLLLIFDNFENQLERRDDKFEIADEILRTFITTLIKATATKTHFLFTSRYYFEIDDRRLGAIHALPLEDLSRPEALSLMQKLQHLAGASYEEKVKALEAFGGHPYALVTLDRYCNHQPLNQALKEANSIHTELRSFLAIELNYAQLSERSRALLEGLAAFRQSVPYEAAEWVLGQNIPYPTEIRDQIKGILAEKSVNVTEAEVAEFIHEKLPQRRDAGDITAPIRELIDWGLLTLIEEDQELRELSVHALVRDFCRYKQSDETWRTHLRDAAAFYTNSSKLTATKNKLQAVVWAEMEAFELLIEAVEFDQAADLLIDVTITLQRWGFGKYLESQYRRLLEKVDHKRMAAILHNLGTLVELHGDYEQALAYFERSLRIAEELGNASGMALSLHEIGIIYQHRGEYQKALEYYHRSLTIKEELGKQSEMASTLLQIGNIQRELGDHEQALAYFQRTLQIAEESANRSVLAKVLHHIGMIHQQQNNDEEALAYYQNSLKLMEELGDRAGLAGCLHHIGIIQQGNGEHEKALENYERSLRFTEELGDRVGVAAALGQIGTVQEDRGNYEQAMVYYQRSLQISVELGNPLFVGISNHQIGRLLSEVGDYDKAFRYALTALDIFQKLQSPHVQKAQNVLKEIRAKWGNENFDVAWKDTTETGLPDWVKE